MLLQVHFAYKRQLFLYMVCYAACTWQCNQLLEAARSAAASPVVGQLPKDKHTGKLVEVWNSALAGSGLAQVDVSGGIADLLAVKDANEVGLCAWGHVDGGHPIRDTSVLCHA